MRTALGLVLAGAFLIILALPAAASAQLPVGSADGVRIVRERGAIVVVFTRSATRLWRRVAGKRVDVFCERGPEPDPDNPGFSFSEGGGSTFRAPKRGRRIRTGDRTRGMDVCELSLPARTVRRKGKRVRLPRRLIVAIPLTQRGAVRLDEQARARALLIVLDLAAVFGQQGNGHLFAPSADLVARLPRYTPRPRLTIVALAGPADTPPAGSLGYYSDGAEHAATVVLSGSGRRLFLEADTDNTIRTNVAEYIYGDR